MYIRYVDACVRVHGRDAADVTGDSSRTSDDDRTSVARCRRLMTSVVDGQTLTPPFDAARRRLVLTWWSSPSVHRCFFLVVYSKYNKLLQ